MSVTQSEFKKTYRVYAVVGAACANGEFRRKLFGAFDPHSADRLREEVDRCLALSGDSNPHVTNDELAMIWAFVGPRTVSPALVPPIQAQWIQRQPTIMTFEPTCDAFEDSVCPHWPCDANS